MNIEIYTDGSSHRNGKPDCVGGWATVLKMADKTYIRYGFLEAPSSNNRAEIFGVLFALHTLKSKPDWHLDIHSDSQYVVKSINEWHYKWKKSGYEGIKNPDLFIPLFNEWDSRGNAKITWVKAHVGIALNELADEYAGLGSSNQRVEITNDLYDIKFIDSESVYQKFCKGG